MAAPGGVAAGVGVGVGAGEEDVPDVRFIYYAPKMDVKKNRSKSWLSGNENSPFKDSISFDDKEQLFIKVLRKYNIHNDELTIEYEASDQLRRQPPHIVEQIDRACTLSQALGRKRRHVLFLKIMLESVARRAGSSMVQVPPKYRNSAQLKGDIKSLKEGAAILFEQLVETCDLITGANGAPIDIAEVFRQPLELPKVRK